MGVGWLCVHSRGSFETALDSCGGAVRARPGKSAAVYAATPGARRLPLIATAGHSTSFALELGRLDLLAATGAQGLDRYRRGGRVRAGRAAISSGTDQVARLLPSTKKPPAGEAHRSWSFRMKRVSWRRAPRFSVGLAAGHSRGTPGPSRFSSCPVRRWPASLRSLQLKTVELIFSSGSSMPP